jgi:predicted regulator of Ras-like GTPase activity (Roadblock/LC7/MglB family)
MIVGNDGVVLETDSQSFRAEAEGLAAEYAAFCRTSLKVTIDTDMGGLHSALLVTDHGKILLQTLTSEYFLVMLLQPGAYHGKACFEMSRVADPLEHELMV